MKRLLLNSSNIKPVNIRIVSNGVQCADLKMLKENFCISDIKDVLDSRLVKWLNNIGEKELAQKVKDSFPTPDSVIGKEFDFCKLISDLNNIREYAQILGKGTDRQLIRKEIKSIPRLIIELHSLYPDKYTSLEWIDLFESSYECEESKQMILNIKKKIKEEEEEKVRKEYEKEEEDKKAFREFLTYLIEYCENHNVLYEGEKAKQTVSSYLDSLIINDVYKKCAKSIIKEDLDYGGNNTAFKISLKLDTYKQVKSFNDDNFKKFLKSLLELTQIPLVDSLQEKYTNKYTMAYNYRRNAIIIMNNIWYKWNEKTQEEKRNKINGYLNENNLSQFCL